MKPLKIEDNKLYTPIVRYKRNDLEITAIGAIHVGKVDYYAKLQREINTQPFGFYEGVKPAKAALSLEMSKRCESLASLNSAYEKMAKYLGLVMQKNQLSYGKQWVNPDMMLDELVIAVPTKKLETLSNLDKEFDKFEKAYQNHPNELKRVLSFAFLSLFKLKSMFPSFFDLISKNPLNDSVILDKRNQVLFNAITPRINEPESNFGIVYGSYHLQGLDKFLLSNKFKVEGDCWVKAWEFDDNLRILDSFVVIVQDMKK